MFPAGKYLEMFARDQRDGWIACGESGSEGRNHRLKNSVRRLGEGNKSSLAMEVASPNRLSLLRKVKKTTQRMRRLNG
jgi:hypothetical protein